jgi:superfamily I DNA/RNA helicase
VKLEDKRTEAAKKAKGISKTDLRDFAEIEAEIEALTAVPKFIYHPDKDTYGDGALQHGQVLDATAWLLLNRPTLRTILQDRHPIILIDESQDTMKSVLDSLMTLAEPMGSGLTLGLLGDHRQRIYMDGHADLPGLVPPGWAKPELKMNHRSQQRIVQLINKIWAAKLAGRTVHFRRRTASPHRKHRRHGAPVHWKHIPVDARKASERSLGCDTDAAGGPERCMGDACRLPVACARAQASCGARRLLECLHGDDAH